MPGIHELLGIETLHPHQEEAIGLLVDAKRDTLLLVPTGAGKSHVPRGEGCRD